MLNHYLSTHVTDFKESIKWLLSLNGQATETSVTSTRVFLTFDYSHVFKYHVEPYYY